MLEKNWGILTDELAYGKLKLFYAWNLIVMVKSLKDKKQKI
ncbi:hypothetical protein [Clostridium perfringens]|uniref:Uncharacterized protein n=1 Tax=Clostridium perfringens TaxID=1502 RepID=A0A4Y5T338_CLOPF|nr:hypothetical protein [Clostridium perfringens]QDB00935.1 hypothetical protein [Clostridium perfringens]